MRPASGRYASAAYWMLQQALHVLLLDIDALDVGLIGLLGGDQVDQLGRQIDVRPFERAGFERAERRRSRRAGDRSAGRRSTASQILFEVGISPCGLAKFARAIVPNNLGRAVASTGR